MDLTFTEAAKERVARYPSPDKKIILDYDDGVGPFSKLGDCSLAANYKLIFVDKDADLPDFDAPQYTDGMELRFNPTYFVMSLTSPHGVLTDSVEILDVTEPVNANATQGTTHDC